MTRVLVTGGEGFIGSHVVAELMAAGHEVVSFDNLDPGAHRVEPEQRVDARFVRGDVANADAVRAALDGVDAISHQAAMVGLGVDFADAPAYAQANDLGTAVLLAVLHELEFSGPIVLASSVVVYGEGQYRCARHGNVRPPPRNVKDLDAGDFEAHCPGCNGSLEPESVAETAPTDPRNVYAATKLHQEHLTAAFTREHPGVPVSALRYHNVYGPQMPRDTPYAGVASIFRSAFESGRAPLVFEDGGQRRDFIHVTDVARANRLAFEAGASGPFNIATGDPHTVLDMACALHAEFAEAPGPQVTGAWRTGDVRHVVASPERARKELGFEASVSFAAGMREFARAPLRA